MHLSALSVYPVKSCRGLPVAESAVGPTGLAGDREWMVLDGSGRVVTARRVPALLLVRATPAVAGGIVLSAAGRPSLPVALPVVGTVPVPDGTGHLPVVGMSGMDRALDAGPAAAAWLSEVLGEPAHLVRLDDSRPRPVAGKHGGRPGDSFNLSDAGPVLLTTTASLKRLDGWIAERAARHGQAPARMAMARFRPNVVVDGVPEPFAEDGWSAVRIGDVTFRFSERCDRCVMTTIDPDTLAGGKEPIRTLADHRREDGNVWFGIRLIPTARGSIRLGDPVEAT